MKVQDLTNEEYEYFEEFFDQGMEEEAAVIAAIKAHEEHQAWLADQDPECGCINGCNTCYMLSY